jgi:hypothetical protein
MDKTEKKNYYETFKEKHTDKISEKHICSVCGGTFTYFNASKHKKTQRHLNALQIYFKLKQELFNDALIEEPKK